MAPSASSLLHVAPEGLPAGHLLLSEAPHALRQLGRRLRVLLAKRGAAHALGQALLVRGRQPPHRQQLGHARLLPGQGLAKQSQLVLEEGEGGGGEEGEEEGYEELPPYHLVEGSTDALIEELRRVDDELAQLKLDMAFYGDTDSEEEDDDEEEGEDPSDSEPEEPEGNEDDEDPPPEYSEGAGTSSTPDRGWEELSEEEAIALYRKRENRIGRGSTCSGTVSFHNHVLATKISNPFLLSF